MNKTNRNLSAIVAQGWTMMFIVFIANMTIDMTKCAVLANCPVWASHIGIGGVKFITVIMVIYAVMPMLIRSISAQWLKYFVVAMSVFITLFYVAHELTHLKDKEFGIYHALDICHHLLGIWVIVAASQWARQKE